MDMLEALKVFVEVFNNATTTALWGFVFYGLYKLVYLGMIVFPVLHGVKFLIGRMFVDEKTTEDNKSSRLSAV